MVNEHPSQDQITLYAADQLEADEAASVRAHLQQGCPICAGMLREAELTLALLAGAVPPVKPPANLFERIENAIHADARPKRQFGNRLLIGFGSAAAAAAITLGIVWTVTAPKRELLDSSNLHLVSLGGSANAKARGRVLWDQEHHRWQVKVFDLTPPPPGKIYELWFITTDQQKIQAATFNTDASGSASLMVAVPANIGPLAMAAVTDEPVGGSAQPTGSIQLVGKITQ